MFLLRNLLLQLFVSFSFLSSHLIYNMKEEEEEEERAEKMKWKLRMIKKNDAEKEKPSSSSFSSSSSPSSEFSISRFLSLSWISKLKPKKDSGTNRGVYSPPECLRRLPETDSRFPPPVPEAPSRLSLGEYEGSYRRRMLHERETLRRHHHSVDGFELVALGHLIPFSTQSRSAESDSGTEQLADSDPDTDDTSPRSTELDSRSWRRRSETERPTNYSDRRHNPYSTDEQARGSAIGGKVRRRARAEVRVGSPQTSAKRAEDKVTAAAAEAEAEEGARGLERFAVVKKSSDPQRDFMQSMVEMIRDQGIGRPEELESLLACYLYLNAEELHDVIVRVFRDVSLQLIRTGSTRSKSTAVRQSTRI